MVISLIPSGLHSDAFLRKVLTINLTVVVSHPHLTTLFPAPCYHTKKTYIICQFILLSMSPLLECKLQEGRDFCLVFPDHISCTYYGVWYFVGTQQTNGNSEMED